MMTLATAFILAAEEEGGSGIDLLVPDTAELITGIIAFTIVFIVDVPVAWALYVLFRSLSRDLSLLAAWFRLVYTVLLGVALIFFFVALQLLNGADYWAAFGPGQVDAHALLAVGALHHDQYP